MIVSLSCRYKKEVEKGGLERSLIEPHSDASKSLDQSRESIINKSCFSLHKRKANLSFNIPCACPANSVCPLHTLTFSLLFFFFNFQLQPKTNLFNKTPSHSHSTSLSTHRETDTSGFHFHTKSPFPPTTKSRILSGCHYLSQFA